MRLEQWSLGFERFDPYKAPEMHVPVLQGLVYGNENFDDGTFVHTSHLVAHDGVDTLYTKSGSRYVLGEVDPEYEAQFPMAKERLFKQLPRRS